MFNKILKEIEINVFDTNIHMLEHYIETEIDAKKRKQARELLEETKNICFMMEQAILNLKDKFKLTDNSNQIIQIQNKLESDYTKSEAFFKSVEHIANVFKVDKTALTAEIVGGIK